MRLLTPLCTILLTLSFSQRAVRAQDSEIIINDNGGVPLENQRRKAPAKKRKKAASCQWSTSETHIHYEKGIQYKDGEYFIEYNDGQADYTAVCLQTSDGQTFDLRNGLNWRFTTLARDDNSVISSSNNHHIHIDAGKTMSYCAPNDMDDPDDTQKKKKNQLEGARFKDKGLDYLDYKHPFIIHYCGPKGCLDQKGVDQCANAVKMKQ